MRKLFVLMKPHLFILSFMSLALGYISVKYHHVEYLRISCLYSPLGLHGVMSYIKVFYPFWVYFCVWCKLVVKFHFFFCIELSTSPNRRGYFCSILCFCCLCWILIDRGDMGLFLGSLFYSIDLCVCSCVSIRLFWLQWPCNIFWCQILWSLQLCSSFSKLLQLFGWTPINFLIHTYL